MLLPQLALPILSVTLSNIVNANKDGCWVVIFQLSLSLRQCRLWISRQSNTLPLFLQVLIPSLCIDSKLPLMSLLNLIYSCLLMRERRPNSPKIILSAYLLSRLATSLSPCSHPTWSLENNPMAKFSK